MREFGQEHVCICRVIGRDAVRAREARAKWRAGGVRLRHVRHPCGRNQGPGGDGGVRGGMWAGPGHARYLLRFAAGHQLQAEAVRPRVLPRLPQRGRSLLQSRRR